MKTLITYFFLITAIFFGTASNIFAKNAEGFTKFLPSFFSAITIILCMFSLSHVMKSLQVGITYASFAGLCIIATSVMGLIKFGQIPNFFSILGLVFIIAGVFLVNFFGHNNI